MDYEIIKYDAVANNISQEDLDVAAKLYNESFPENERDWSFSQILEKTKKDNRLQLLIMFADPLETGKKQVVAFDLIVVEEKFVYTIFIASQKQFGIKAYGGKLGKYVMNELAKDKFFFFIAEKVEDTAENKDQRRKRQLFFHRYGLHETGFERNIGGVVFDLYAKGNATLEESYAYSKLVNDIYYS